MTEDNYASTSQMPYSRRPNPVLMRAEHNGGGSVSGSVNGSVSGSVSSSVGSSFSGRVNGGIGGSAGDRSSRDLLPRASTTEEGPINDPAGSQGTSEQGIIRRANTDAMEWRRQSSIDSTASEGSQGGHKRRSRKSDGTNTEGHPSTQRKNGSSSTRRVDETEEERAARRARREREHNMRMQNGEEYPTIHPRRHNSRPSNSSHSSANVSSPKSSETIQTAAQSSSLATGLSLPTPNTTSKSVLTVALQRAQSAVLLDSANNVPAAITAYEQSVKLLQEVIGRVEEGAKREKQRTRDKDLEGLRLGEADEDRAKRHSRAERKERAKLDEVRRLRVIHNTYEDRIGTLLIMGPAGGQQLADNRNSHLPRATQTSSTLVPSSSLEFQSSLLPTTSVSPFVAEMFDGNVSRESAREQYYPDLASSLPASQFSDRSRKYPHTLRESKLMGSPTDPMLGTSNLYDSRHNGRGRTKAAELATAGHNIMNEVGDDNMYGSASSAEYQNYQTLINTSSSLAQYRTPIRSESITPRAGGSFSSIVTAKGSATQTDMQTNVTESIRSAHRKLASISSLDHSIQRHRNLESFERTPDIVLQTETSSSTLLNSYADTGGAGKLEGQENFTTTRHDRRKNPYEVVSKEKASSDVNGVTFSDSEVEANLPASSMDRLQSQDSFTNNLSEWYIDRSRSQDLVDSSRQNGDTALGNNVSSSPELLLHDKKPPLPVRDELLSPMYSGFAVGQNRPHPIRSASLAPNLLYNDSTSGKAPEKRVDILRQHSSPTLNGPETSFNLKEEKHAFDGGYVVAEAADEEALRSVGRRASFALPFDQGELGRNSSGHAYQSASLPSRLRNAPLVVKTLYDEAPYTIADQTIAHPTLPHLPTNLSPYSSSYHNRSTSRSTLGSSPAADGPFDELPLPLHPPQTIETMDIISPVRPTLPAASASAVFPFGSAPLTESTNIPSSPYRRPFHIMHLLVVSIERGGFLTSKLHVSKQVWRQPGVKLPNLEAKARTLELLATGLEGVTRAGEDMLPHASTDQQIGLVNRDACARLLKELENLESMMDGIQNTLGKKLGFMIIPGSTNRKLGASLSAWSSKLSKGLDKVTAGRVDSPANYVDSIARTLEHAQALGLHVTYFLDSQGGYANLNAGDLQQFDTRYRRISEFLDNFLCRFVLQDLGLLVDKFVKRSGASLGIE